MHRVGHTVVQGIEVFTGRCWQNKLLPDQVEHILLGLGVGKIGVQKVVPQTLGSFLQVRHAKRADRLNDIRSYGSKWHVHPRFTFLKLSPNLLDFARIAAIKLRILVELT